jgi:hypothetical protein
MANLPSKNKHILRIVLLSLAAIPVIFILIIIVSTILTSLFDNVDKAKFERLNDESSVMYQQLKRASGGLETWTYKTHCDEWKTGDWPTGEFECMTTIATVVPVTSIAAFVALHEKYYPIIDHMSVLKPINQLDEEYPTDFGKKFVVSSAEKHYDIDGADSVRCDYLGALDQASDDADIGYGLEIIGGVAHANIHISCQGHARGDWYQ